MSRFTREFNKPKEFDTDAIVVEKIELENIIPDPHQVREQIDEEKLKELAYSIKEQGILNPLHVRASEEIGKYIILTGERRFRAAQTVGQSVVPCIVHREAMSEADIKAIQLIENLQRQDLSAIETSRGFDSLLKQGMTVSDISRTLGVSESLIKKSRVILRRVPGNWLTEIEKKCSKASMEQVYNIAKEKNRKKQTWLYRKMMKEIAQVEVEESEEEAKGGRKEKQKQAGFDDSQLQIIWENLRKIVKRDRSKLVQYIRPQKIQELLKYGEQENK
jgi:ParB family chromosome partitioning protein